MRALLYTSVVDHSRQKDDIQNGRRNRRGIAFIGTLEVWEKNEEKRSAGQDTLNDKATGLVAARLKMCRRCTVNFK